MGIRPDDRAKSARSAHVAPAAPATTLDGKRFRSLFEGASSLLQRHTGALNAINVFPVPDGDTGTNMSLTLRAGIDELARTGDAALSSAAGALAHGTLMGARGNSGVILSQVLRGLAAGLEGHREADGPALALALGRAADATYALRAGSVRSSGRIPIECLRVVRNRAPWYHTVTQF